MTNNSGPKNDRFAGYVPVAERIEKFYERFPDGRLITSIVEHSQETGFILMRAEVYRGFDDALPAATGHAYEYRDAGHVQKNNYIEVCETSAVGRALAFLGLEVKRGIASREEMQKAERVPAKTEESPKSDDKRSRAINRIKELWQQEEELGAKRPANETAELLLASDTPKLIELGTKIGARVRTLADQKAVMDERRPARQ